MGMIHEEAGTLPAGALIRIRLFKDMVAAAEKRPERIDKHGLLDEVIEESAAADENYIFLCQCQGVVRPVSACREIRGVERVKAFRRRIETDRSAAVDLCRVCGSKYIQGCFQVFFLVITGQEDDGEFRLVLL